MFIIAQYNVSLSIEACVAFYSNFEVNLRDRVRELYEGLCVNGCLIVHIHRIVRVGECQLNNTGNPSRGSLSVTFDARVVQYSRGDIIGGCIASETSSDRIPALTPSYAELIFARDIEAARDEALSVVSPGATMIANARIVCANPGAQRISVQASLYEPTRVVKYWPIIARAKLDDGEWSPRYWIPAEFREEGIDSDSCDIFEYLRAIREAWSREVASAKGKTPFAQHVGRLFRAQKCEDVSSSLRPICVLDSSLGETIRNAFAIAIVPCDDPLECQVRIIESAEQIGANWECVRPAQLSEIVIIQCCEYFADIHLAAIETLRALIDENCARASKALITAQMARIIRAIPSPVDREVSPAPVVTEAKPAEVAPKVVQKRRRSRK